MKKLYIRAAQAISIQEPLTAEGVWEPKRYNSPYVRCLEPHFADFIPPMEGRRMSPIIKRAITTALACVRQSGVTTPDAIVMGTGLGCLSDTEKFLTAMLDGKEEMLPPSAFIQSTHNTIASQIAIRLGNNGFNNTHVQKGISFESALHEVFVLCQLGEVRTALVGGHDELTPKCFDIARHNGYWRSEIPDTLEIQRKPDDGTFGTEGSTCFMLSDESGDVSIDNVEIGYDSHDYRQAIKNFLKASGVELSQVDVVMTGRDGDQTNDAIYHEVLEGTGLKEVFYKNLCGEYETASAYGLFTALQCVLRHCIPAHLTFGNRVVEPVRRILLFNHWKRKYYSLILLSSCGD
jgi:3-oxoacyl-(acyl-carrier-protein) synthase